MDTIAKMPMYKAYKASGVEWIQDVPESWNLAKIKNYAIVFSGDSLNDKQKAKYELGNHNNLPYISSKDIDLKNSQINCMGLFSFLTAKVKCSNMANLLVII